MKEKGNYYNFQALNNSILILQILMLFSFSFYESVYAVSVNQVKPVHYFVNNESELTELRDKLLKNGKVGITGISGKGKSELAKKYAEHYQNEYELIAFVNADLDFTPQYVEIAKSINSSGKQTGNVLSLNPNDVKNEVMKYLSKIDKWLLIYDNLKINQNIRIQDIMEWENNGHIIFTTQDTQNLPYRVEMNYLKDKDVMQLINNIIKMPSDHVTSRIVERCKGYPYLVSKISTFVANNKHKNIDEVIDYIDKSDNPVSGFTKLLLNSLNQSAAEMLLKISLLNGEKISRNLINIISSGYSKQSIADDIHQLVMLGAMQCISDDIEEQYFRVHELLQLEVIKNATGKQKQELVNSIIDSLNNILPENYLGARHKIIADDISMISNIEKLLISAEKYNADFYKNMKLCKYVMDYYIGIRDNNNSEKMAQWLIDRQNRIDLTMMGDDEKDIYAYYLAKIGAYEELIRNNNKKGEEYYKQAIVIADSTSLLISKMTSRFQLARLQIFTGDVASAKQTVNEMLNLQYDHDDKTWYLQVKILIAEKQYEKALPLAIWGIKEYAKTGDNNSANFFHLSLVESEIRNNLKNYQSAYDIAAQLNRLNKENMSNPTITKGRILIQLARAEYGLGDIKKALQDIETTISSLLQNPITLLIEKDLADAYSVKADILSLAKNKGNEALQMYDKAESLYYNLYRGNIRNMQNVADVYSNAAKVSCVVGDNKSYRRFFSKLKKYFGSKNPLTLEVEDFCKTKCQE